MTATSPVRFTWHDDTRSWRLTQRGDGRPLVPLWPELRLELQEGRPVLIVPPLEEEDAT